jgi:hypothetical protein
MRTFIQLKDSVGWASVNTEGYIEGSIEVDSGTGDFYIKKRYEDGVWSDANLIRYAEINEGGDIIEIKNTYFSSEVNGPIMNSDTNSNFKWINGEWVLPTAVEETTSDPS